MIAAERVTVVLLAAGLSRRFGPEDKLLADVGGKPLAAHAADTIGTIGFGSLIAVCSSDPVAELLAERGFLIVRNDRPEDGQSRSIRLGIEAAGEAEAVLIALADMPFVSVRHYRRLLAEHDDVTASSLGGVGMPPALFGTARFDDLHRFSGDQGAKALLVDATLVEGQACELEDIDKPAALIPPRPAPSA